MTHTDERLRRRPPARALDWCAVAVARDAEVTAVHALPGATSSAVHAVDVRGPSARVHRLVLRRFVLEDWLAEEPSVPRHEAAALAIAAATAVPTPELVALDPDGAEAGDPALLMTRLPGAVRRRPRDLEPCLRALAEILPAVHATPLPPGHELPDYAPYALHADRPPAWSTRPAVWERAFEVFRGPPPHAPRRFIHRDFHAGNVLWSGGAVSGLVDWPNASVGAAGADVGHCRMNLHGMLGPEAADRFATLCGGDHHPYWDVVAVLGGVYAGDWDRGDEAFLAAAIRAL